MNKKTKIWLIVAASLILIGALIFGGVMSVLKWDFKKLSTAKYVEKEYTVDTEYKNIVIETDRADVTLLPASDGITRAICYESENIKYLVSVEDESLVVKMIGSRKWYEHIGIFSHRQELFVYLPAEKYNSLSANVVTGDITVPSDFTFDNTDINVTTGDVNISASATGKIKIKTTTGDIKLENVSAGEIDLSYTTGDVYLADISCNDLKAVGSTGDATLENVICVSKMQIKNTTGDVCLEKCDAGEINIQTNTGDVTGSLNSDKMFNVKTTTGDVDVPNSTSGGICAIKTTTGDVEITVN